MRILYDGRIYQIQSAGGINRYYANLISRLPASFIPTFTTQNLVTFIIQLIQILECFIRFGSSRSISSWLEKCTSALLLLLIALILLTLLYIADPTRLEQVPLSCRTYCSWLDSWAFLSKLIPVVWKLIINEKQWQQKHYRVLKTLKDLLERYPSLVDRVTVTYLASDIDASISHGSEPVPARPYYLYVWQSH